MSGALVHRERRSDGVAVLRIDNGKVNALSTAVLGELASALSELASDLPRAVAVLGNGRMLAAGADVSELDGPAGARKVTEAFHSALDALAGLPRPTVAAVAGFALGGGFELALACDLRIAGDTARVGFPEVLLGTFPGGGGTQRVARLVGPARAKSLIFSGRQVRAHEALALGLVDEVVPAAHLEDVVLERAGELAAGPSVALGLAKRAIDGGLDGSLAEGLALEKELFVESFSTRDSAIGVETFLEQGPGKASFEGR